MATTTTSFTPTPLVLPFAGARPNPSQDQSIIPNSEVIFRVNSGSIDLSGVGDVQRAIVDCLLPPGWGYLMTDWACSLADTVAGDTADWDDEAQLLLRDSSTSEVWRYTMGCSKPALGFSASTTLKSAAFAIRGPLLEKFIIPSVGSAQLFFSSFNLVTNQAAMVIQYFARFIRYDVNQAYNWPINTPFYR